MEVTAPTVTVVMPVFNGANYLEESIQSVLAQTYREFEMILVDDGSTDTTWTIIEQYISTYPDLIRGIRKTNGGVSSALNAGIRAAKGKYFAWLSHDDLWLPTKLEKQLDLLHWNPDAVGVYSDYSFIDEAGDQLGRVYAPWYSQSEVMRHLLQLQFINGSTVLVERKRLLEVGLFDETMRYTQEIIMWMQLLNRYSFLHVPEPLTSYRLHLQQTTAKKKDAIFRELRATMNHLLEIYPLQTIFPELNHPRVNSDELAKAYLYLGDIYTNQHACLWVGILQYWHAWRVWPNRKNPAPRRILHAIWHARATAEAIRTWHVGWTDATSPRQNRLVDCRSWHERFKQITF